MKKEIKISPPNSTVLLMDYENGNVPSSFSGALIAATSSCIAIGTLAETDGLTTITLCDIADCQPPSSMSVAYDGDVELSVDRLSLCTVLNEIVEVINVEKGTHHLRIYVNDSSEPDQIFIAIS